MFILTLTGRNLYTSTARIATEKKIKSRLKREGSRIFYARNVGPYL